MNNDVTIYGSASRKGSTFFFLGGTTPCNGYGMTASAAPLGCLYAYRGGFIR